MRIIPVCMLYLLNYYVMKKESLSKFQYFFILFLAISSVQAFSQQHLSALIPMPNHIESKDGRPFSFFNDIYIQTNLTNNTFLLSELESVLTKRVQHTIKITTTKTTESSIIKLLTDSSITQQDAYVLEITEKCILIKGQDEGAIFYGLKTLDQLLLGDIQNTSKGIISSIKITDSPRYNHRALMLDPARHFIPLKDVKFYIDQMAKFKFNILQLHLTDDQGWRIEIKKHPLLTQKGAFRNPDAGANGPDNGFYTQEDMKDLITYAADRNIEIIPEIDIPGHTVAVLSAYPELGCTHTDTMIKVVGKTVNLMLCASNQKVYQIYDDILKEILQIFPSKTIHLGGDEAAIKENWGACKSCQKLMKELNYKQEKELMSYFFSKMLYIVKKNEKKAVLWCELDNIRMPANKYLFAYPKDVTLMTWRGGLTPKCIDLTSKSGHSLIMAPGEFTYFDYPQYEGDFPEYNNWGMPILTLEKAYAFDPGYNLPQAQQKHILGVTGTLWGEAIKDINRLNYMTYPRALALSEAAWTDMNHRSWSSFKNRIYPNLTDLIMSGVSVRSPFEITDRMNKQ